MNSQFPLDWRATPIFEILVQIGKALGTKRLHPSILNELGHGINVIPNHKATLRHVSGKVLGRRKGYYEIWVEGPNISGRWKFTSGDLELISSQLAAASSD
ncbi:hypothetical protein EHI47_11660 [Rhizobium leguminosarum]|uniref:Uncharacterized protein n=1 Tax=Rhizobium leguminosarum TaxID=384 RepID=A0A444I348_RHILE|nr:hypothetical protein [Rhizobium leguminosarum]RWX32032.1 hypothetical protein EHI47_11660 [Rhizobium leguminosarum]